MAKQMVMKKRENDKSDQTAAPKSMPMCHQIWPKYETPKPTKFAKTKCHNTQSNAYYKCMCGFDANANDNVTA